MDHVSPLIDTFSSPTRGKFFQVKKFVISNTVVVCNLSV